MAEIAHAYDEATVPDTHTGDALYTDIAGIALTDGDLIDGKKYLIVACAQLHGSNLAGNFGIRVVHGSTAFDESEMVMEPSAVAADRFYTYTWFTVWTAVVGEGLKMQFKTVNTGHTVEADQLTLFAMNLSDDLTEGTDWFFDEDPADLSMTSTFQGGGSVSFTPAAGDDWLVMSFSQLTPAATNRQAESRLSSSGTFTETEPLLSQEGEDNVNDLMMHTLMRVFPALGAVAQTFTEESRRSTNGGTRFHSAVFALNLNKFDRHANAWTEAELALGDTPNYVTEVQTVSITPTVAGDVWAMGGFAFDANENNSPVKSRLQVDDADQPPTQTSDFYRLQQSWDPADEVPLRHMTVENLTAAAHNIDIDASGIVTPLGRAEDRSLFAVTMELAGAGLQTLIQGDLFGVSLGSALHVVTAGAVSLTQTVALTIALGAPTHALELAPITLTQGTPPTIVLSAPTHAVSAGPVTLTQGALLQVSLSAPTHIITAGPVTLTQATPLAVSLGAPTHTITSGITLTQGSLFGITIGAPTHTVTAGAVTLTQGTPLAVTLGAPTHSITPGPVTLIQGTPLAILFTSPTHAITPGPVVLAATPAVVTLGAPTHAVQPGAVTLSQPTPLAAAFSAPVHVVTPGAVTLTQPTPVGIALGSPIHIITSTLGATLVQTAPLVITLAAPVHRIFYRGHVREDLRRAAGLPIPHREAME